MKILVDRSTLEEIHFRLNGICEGRNGVGFNCHSIRELVSMILREGSKGEEINDKIDDNKNNLLVILDFLCRILELDNTMTPNRQRSLRSSLYLDITDLKDKILGVKR